MQHHKKISEKKYLLVAIFASTALVLAFQIYSLLSQYDYLSQIIANSYDESLNEAINTYRTSRFNLYSGDDTQLSFDFSDKINTTDESEENVTRLKSADIGADSGNESIDNLFYKINSYLIAQIPLSINSLDSLYSSILKEKKIFSEYNIVIYKAKSDSIIVESNSEFKLLHPANVSRKELDTGHDVQVYFKNPVRFILQKMALYLILSGIILIIIVLVLVFQFRIIAKQKKIEQIRQDFTDSMVHELRNPLQSALSMAELAENETFSQNLKRRNEVIRRIKNNLNNLSQVLNSLAERSYSEHTQQVANWQIGNLMEYINEIIDNISASTNKPIYFKTDFVSDIINCQFDHVHLPNALKNLVENSIKYSGDSVSVEITTAIEDVFLHIKIADDGNGINKEDLPHIFTKYYRGNSVQKKHGFGLGLSYVKWVAELHDGNVTVKSNPDNGSEFVITIPLKVD